MGYIYSWLSAIYGDGLDYFLWGYDCNAGSYKDGDIYTLIAVISIVIVISLIFMFYKVIDHPRTSQKWGWFLICGALVSTINLFVGALWTLSYLNDGQIPQCEGFYVTDFNCWMFGVANAIVSFIIYFAMSALLKRWISKNNKHTPWISKWWVKTK